MEEVRKFLVERKRSIKLTAIEKWCGIPAGTLRPETRAIPAK